MTDELNNFFAVFKEISGIDAEYEIKKEQKMRTYKTSKQNVLYGNDEYIKTHTREEIMNRFGVDYNTVNNFCHKIGIKPIARRRQTLSLPEGFAEYAKEHSAHQIASHFNLNYPFVVRCCNKMGIEFVSRKQRKEYKDDGRVHDVKRCGLAQDMIIELSKTFTYASIARVFGYSKERIRQICMETKETE